MACFGNPGTRRVLSGQNSLQGALIGREQPASLAVAAASAKPPVDFDTKFSPSQPSLDEEMQRQLQDYNRSVTIIIWYKAEEEPIRLQHMNSTFPCFQLLQLSSVITDLGLTPTSYLDAYDPHSGKWEQHTIATVRIVATQQRLLYKLRRSLLEGLRETECIGLQEEVQKQFSAAPIVPTPDVRGAKQGLKRFAPDATPAGPQPKVHIPNHFYAEPSNPPAIASATVNVGSPQAAVYRQPSPSLQLLSTPPSSESITTSSNVISTGGAPPSHLSRIYSGVPSLPTPAPEAEPSLPPHSPSTEPQAQPIAHHPHPPLKRWPNDYTVSELTAGFNAMEALIRQPPNGVALTQRSAFERVFGSRYVKSTVCRHRGVWRKAEGSALREQFEAMGTDERACWGEFVRRIEGRVPVNGTGGIQTVEVGAPPTTISRSTRP